MCPNCVDTKHCGFVLTCGQIFDDIYFLFISISIISCIDWAHGGCFCGKAFQFGAERAHPSTDLICAHKTYHNISGIYIYIYAQIERWIVRGPVSLYTIATHKKAREAVLIIDA